MKNPQARDAAAGPPRVSPAVLAVLLAVIAGIIVTGVVGYHQIRRTALKQVDASLLGAARIKAAAVRDWRNERLGAGAILHRNPLIFRALRQAIGNPSSPVAAELAEYLAAVQVSLDYRRIVLWSADRTPVLSVPEAAAPFGTDQAEHVAEALRTGEMALSEIYRDGTSGDLLIDLAIPLEKGRAEGGGTFGAFIFQIDPRRYLFPMIQSLPGLSSSAEALLLRRDGDQVVFLSDARHFKDSALKLKIPLTESRRASVLAAQGMEGLVEAMDYRGIDVRAALLPVPDSDWFIVAKADMSEILAPVHRQGRLLTLFVAVLIAGTILGARALRRSQGLRFYRRLYEAERERSELSHRYEAITRHANDIILLFEDDGTIVEANANALKTYGYDPAELIGKNIRDLRDPLSRHEVDGALQKVRREGNARYEAVHVRKDGALFPVEISISAFSLQGKNHFLALYRDISDRLETERALRESEAKFRTLFNESGDAIFIHDFEGRSLEFNQAALDRLGYSPEELRKLTPMDWDAPEYKDNFRLQAETLAKTGSVRFETVHLTKSGVRIPVEVISRLISYRGLPAILATVRDISQRKEAEEALKKALAEKEILLREVNHRVKNNMQVVSSLLNLQAARVSDPEARRALQESRERVRTMGLIHEKLYRAADIARLDFAEYLRGVAVQTMSSYQGEAGPVRLETAIASVPMDLDQAIPCGLIVTELVSNAMKHAFPGGAPGIVRIEFGPGDKGTLVLAVVNDGRPLPEDYDVRKSGSLGMQIVAMLAEQLGGSVATLREGGTGFRIDFKTPEPKRT